MLVSFRSSRRSAARAREPGTGTRSNAAVVGGVLRESATVPKPVITQPTVMKTQYYTATSLDGFIATEDDSLKWLFPLGDLNRAIRRSSQGLGRWRWGQRHTNGCLIMQTRLPPRLARRGRTCNPPGSSPGGLFLSYKEPKSVLSGETFDEFTRRCATRQARRTSGSLER
jgi:hypothetical protein